MTTGANRKSQRDTWRVRTRHVTFYPVARIVLIAIVVFHIVLIWGLTSGLARKVIEVIAPPIETGHHRRGRRAASAAAAAAAGDSNARRSKCRHRKSASTSRSIRRDHRASRTSRIARSRRRRRRRRRRNVVNALTLDKNFPPAPRTTTRPHRSAWAKKGIDHGARSASAPTASSPKSRASTTSSGQRASR